MTNKEMPTKRVINTISDVIGAFCHLGICKIYHSKFSLCPRGNDGNLPVCYAEEKRRYKLTDSVISRLSERHPLEPEQVSSVTKHIDTRMFTKVPQDILEEMRKRNKEKRAFDQEIKKRYQAALSENAKILLKKAEAKYGGRDQIPWVELREIEDTL